MKKAGLKLFVFCGTLLGHSLNTPPSFATQSTLNSREIVEKIHEKTQLSRQETQRTLEHIFEEITTALAKGDHVVIRRFGTFKVFDNAPKQVIHPITGEEVTKPSTRTIHFKASKKLKKSLETDKQTD
jgi:nucleoid DNA-binding protein